MASALNPLLFKLSGSSLIEASAGTGKTWTIAALYVRLIIGHGCEQARVPGQILVLTYTEAAAQELRDRIRTRLLEAALAFETHANSAQGSGDDFLASLIDAVSSDKHSQSAHALRLAAQAMDESAISTIHSWCARVLQEHAFDSASMFDLRLEPDLERYKNTAVWDYWRACIANLPVDLIAVVRSYWASPEALYEKTKDMLTDRYWLGLPDTDLQELWHAWRAHKQAYLLELKQPWLEGLPSLQEWLLGVAKNISGGVKKYQGWVASLQAWAADGALEQPGLTETAWQRLSAADIASALPAELHADIHPLCEQIGALRVALTQIPAFQTELYSHALVWLAKRLQRLLNQDSVLGFDGLLSNLEAALQSRHGKTLAQTLQRQFPVVLIDEFQDTDQLQYSIFDHIYEIKHDLQEFCVVLIGDPKQAIYSFRGADIHTYLRASRDCANRVYGLRKNYRSSAAVVAAVNVCFGGLEGARFPGVGANRDIEFCPIEAAGLQDRLVIRGSQPAALQVHSLPLAADAKSVSVADYEQSAAHWCALHIARLLALGARQEAGFASTAGQFKALVPNDLAILVSSYKQARIMRQALAEQNIRSVYLSERDSVFESPVVFELRFWLRACLHPSEPSVRAALATPSVGLNDAVLAALSVDGLALNERLERFHNYAHIWSRRGVLPMLRRFMHDFDIPARLLGTGYEGERKLTDIMHLAELLQRAANSLDGPQALMNYFLQTITQAKNSTDLEQQRIRLESDQSLVRIVTIHKSKGLEYPLVFLPFVSSTVGSRQTNTVSKPFLLSSSTGRQWVLAGDPASLEQYRCERIDEEVRKLYVAITRAKHAVWLSLALTNSFAQTGMGQLSGENPQTHWHALQNGAPDIISFEPGLADDALQVLSTDLSNELDPGISTHISTCLNDQQGVRQIKNPVVARHRWWIASYSGLRWAAASNGPETAQAENILEEHMLSAQLPAPVGDGDAALLHDLPDFARGSEAGVFLHGLLEWAGRHGFVRLDEARDLVARRCALRGWEAYIEPLYDWLVRFVRTSWQLPLPEGVAVRFDSLQTCLPEMEFWLPVHNLDVKGLDKLICEHVFPGVKRAALAANTLNGMFKGFIDICFQAVDGRYYLADYKSNNLGPLQRDYSHEKLVEAMVAARYDVQMLVYLLALHRQLKARLPDYDYDKHMGGAVYMFLRGQSTATQGLIALRPEQSLLQRLDDLFAQGNG